MKAKGLCITILLLVIAVWQLPSPASAECSDTAYTDLPEVENMGLRVTSDTVAARKYTLAGNTDIAAVRLRLKRVGGSTGTLVLEYREDVDGHPGSSVYHVTYFFPASDIGTDEPLWYDFTQLADTQPAGTYWVVLRMGPGDANIMWIAERGYQCGTSDDNQSYTNGQWIKSQVEALYQVVCEDCPLLYDCSVSPSTTADNAARTYTYEVTYRNYGDNAPTVAQVKIGATWYDMTRIDSDPYSSGTRYQRNHFARLGVGEHTFDFHFETAGGLSADLTCTGPIVGPGYPGGISTSFTPNPAKTNQTISFSCTASDPDGFIVEYRWRLVKQGTGEEYTFNVGSSNTSENASDIGVGMWDVYTTVVDDDGLLSNEYKNPTPLEIVDESAPEVTGSSASLGSGGGCPGDDAVGVFIPGLGLTVNNKFTATVTDPEADINRVEFTMPTRPSGSATVVDNDGPPYQATFNMDVLPDGGGELEIKAIDDLNHVSAIYKVTILTTNRPSWWGQNWVYNQQANWIGPAGPYTFQCWVPKNPRFNYDYDIDTGGLFGVMDNHFESDIRVEEEFHIDGSPVWWSYYATGVLNCTIMDFDIVDEEYPGSATQLDAARLAYCYDRNLDYYRMTSPQVNLWTAPPIEGPSWDYRGIADFVEYHAGLSTELGFELNLTVGADLNANLSVRTFRITPIPTFSVEFDMFVEIFEGLARLGCRATPTTALDLPIVYAFGNPGSIYADDPCFKFWVDYTVYASACYGWLSGDLYSGSYPDPPYDYPDGCADGLLMKRLTPMQTEKPIFHAPTIASDKQGVSSICVWVHDIDPDPGVMEPELYYSYYPDNRNMWSVPAPVFGGDNGLFDTDPKVIYTAQNNAMLVWTQNQLDRATAEAETHISNLIKEQELFCATWTYNPATKTGVWSAAQNLTNDPPGGGFGDGLVTLGSDENTGTVLAAWVRETDNDSNTRSDWEIYYSWWNGVVWSPAQPLTIDALADAQPDAAMDSNGNAIVVWTQDSDSDFTTNNDRMIAYRTYNSGTGIWSALVTQPTWPEGALRPSVAYDLSNAPIILFTSRGNNSKGQPLQEGASDRLYSACFLGGPPVVMPVGDGPRALEPKVRVDPQNDTVAIWRGFDGMGPAAFAGEVAINLRYAGMPTCANWGGTAYLTDDAATDWQIDFDVDPGGIIRIVYVKKDLYTADPEFGYGNDSIYLMEIPRGPDIMTTDADISFSNDLPAPGEPVIVTARVYNQGNRRAFGPFNVEFSTEGGPFGIQSVSFLAQQTYEDVTQTWFSDGQIHTITVDADSTNIVAEVNEGNNTGSREIGRLSAPFELSAYPDPASGSIVLVWAHAGGAVSYNIYRSETPGSYGAPLDNTAGEVYSDATAAIDTTYYYVVAAVDAAAQESAYSNEASATLGPDFDGDGIPDIADPDDDDDGMSDACEIDNGLDPLDPSDAGLDPDTDTFTNLEECQAGTDPQDPDSHPDVEPPTTPVVSAGPYSTSATELSASWTCSDNYSGIAEYHYAIGTFAGGTDVRTWTSNGVSDVLTATGLSLTNGETYYISVRATDGVGLESEVGISPGITVDTTPPVITSGPTVAAWTPETNIAASWEADDPESSIEKHEYSIGTTPGGTDVVGWTDVGLAMGMNHTGLSLTNGQLYYVNLRVTNRAGLETTQSSSQTRAVHAAATIAEALGLVDGTWLAVSGKRVTGVLGSNSWIEEPDLSAAARLDTSAGIAEGDNVTVSGQMTTPVFTREIAVETVEVESSGNPVTAIAMTNLSIGGEARNAYTPGVTGGVGLNNVCTLVTAWGTVTALGTDYFYMNDGSALQDGSGNVGVRVSTAGLANPSLDEFVVATGLVNASQLVPPDPCRLLIPRRQSDITEFDGGGGGGGELRMIPEGAIDVLKK